jgi:hypothetical protein
MTTRTVVCALVVIVVIALVHAGVPELSNKSVGAAGFTKGRTILIQRPKGGLDEVLELPGGQFAIRDSNFKQLPQQAVGLYSPQGQFQRAIGGYGQGPGQYFAVKQLGFSRQDQLLWVVDMQGRLSRFDLSGKLANTMLLQKPGYRAFGLAVDEAHRVFYMTGCVAKNYFLTDGCYLVHQYDIGKSSHLKSVLETDPLAMKNNYLGVEDYLVDVDAEGIVFAVDGPIHKLWRVDPAKWSIQEFTVRSKVMTPVPAVDPVKPNNDLADRNYLIERVLTSKRHVYLSVRAPGDGGYYLQTFTADGKQTGVDLPSPGRLVGKSNRGGFWFSRKTAAGFELTEYLP